MSGYDSGFTTQSTCAYIMSRSDGYKPWFPLRKRPNPLPKALVMRFFYSERWIVTTVVYYLYDIINEIDIRNDGGFGIISGGSKSVGWHG